MQTPAEFAQALTELRRRAGLTIRQVTARTGIPTATLGGYFSGRHLPPSTQPKVLIDLLTALGVPADELPTWADTLARVRRRPGPRAKVAPETAAGDDGTQA